MKTVLSLLIARFSIMPRRGNSNWRYVYVLLSAKDGNLYIGNTKNLKHRIDQHNAKRSFATKSRAPLRLIYVEACKDEQDAKRRENYLKTSQGGRFLKLRLKNFIKGQSESAQNYI